MALTKLTTDLIDGSLGTDWQATPKTASFTAVAGEGYFVNTTSAAITVTLPGSPSAGDEVSIVDYAGTADTNNIIITSSDNINGSSDDAKINYERGGVSMVYVDATQGWIAYNATNETATGLIDNPPTFDVDYLVVAGGGAGGTGSGIGGGGGGAGGLRTSFGSSSGGGASAETALALLVATNYTVTVGAGAGGPTSGNTSGPSGSDSVFSTITSLGGGGGTTYDPPGISGGSGGGSYRGGVGAGTANQGFDGGVSVSGSSSGGGGGAGGAGQNSNYNTSTVGNGGDGLEVNIIGGTGNYYAGGGGGGRYLSEPGGPGVGGSAIGGNGGSGSAGGNGSTNTGSGGGGAANSQNGGSGGSGVVILRYPNTYTISETTSGGNVLSFTTDDSTVAGTKITTFTAGENGTIQFS